MSATTTSTAASPSAALLQPRQIGRRRLTTSNAGKHVRAACQHLPSSIDALDLSLTSPSTPAQALAAIRLQVLSYLADLETRLTLLEAPVISDSLKSRGESTIEEATTWARTAMEMLASIRSDVSMHLPELHFDTMPSMEDFVKTHMPEPPTLDDVRAHLPAMPQVISSHLSDLTMQDMRSRLEDVRSSFSDIDFPRPLEYIPTLSERLLSLQQHLSSIELPQSIAESFAILTPNATLSEMLDRVLSSDFMSPDVRGGEDMLEKAARDVSRAIRRSLNGSQLIHYVDLPERWRNNRFVSGGYR